MDKIESKSQKVCQIRYEETSAPIFNMSLDIFYHIASFVSHRDMAAFSATCRLAQNYMSEIACHRQVVLIKEFIDKFIIKLDEKRFENEIKKLLDLSASATKELLYINQATKEINTYQETKDIILKIRSDFLNILREACQAKIEVNGSTRKGLTREEMRGLRTQLIGVVSNHISEKEIKDKIKLIKEMQPMFFEAIFSILGKDEWLPAFIEGFLTCSLRVNLFTVDQAIEIYNKEFKTDSDRDRIFLLAIDEVIRCFWDGFDLRELVKTEKNFSGFLNLAVNFKVEQSNINIALKVLFLIAKLAMQLSSSTHNELWEDFSFYKKRICTSNLMLEIIDHIDDQMIIDAFPSDADIRVRDHLLLLCKHAREFKVKLLQPEDHESFLRKLVPLGLGRVEKRVKALRKELYSL